MAAYAALTQRARGCEAELRILATQPAHRVTGVTSVVLLADIGDQRLRTLHLNLEGGDQRVFRVNDNVSRFPLNFKANRKLHLCALPLSAKNSTIQLRGVKLARLLSRCRHVRSNVGDWPGLWLVTLGSRKCNRSSVSPLAVGPV